MRLSALTIFLSVLFLSACATTSPRASTTWIAERTSDPITGQTRCTVTAPDRSFGRSFTRTTFLYPFVEMNSEIGLMVGVSSGGRIRVPPGDIQWRVDELPFRTLSQASTPVIGEPTSYVDASRMAPDVRAIYEVSQQMNAGLLSSIQNGITAVDGREAEAMLQELLNGSGLLFRSSAAAPTAGVPSSSTYRVGQYRNGELTPIPIDQSFHDALSVCGISGPT